MTEAKEGIPRTSDTSREIDSMEPVIDRDDPDQPWDRTRNALKSGELKPKRSRKKFLDQGDVDTSWMTQPEPGPTASRKPWNTKMVKPDKSGKYR